MELYYPLFSITSLILNEIKNIANIKKLKNKNIPTRRIFPPVVSFPPYESYNDQEYKNSYYIYKQGLCLPSSVLNSEDDILYVCKTLRRLVA